MCLRKSNFLPVAFVQITTTFPDKRRHVFPRNPSIQAPPKISNHRRETIYLSREVANHICSVPPPQCHKSFIFHSSLETISNSLVRFRKPTRLDHFILVLDQKLHTLNRSCCCFGYSSRDSSHQKINGKAGKPFLRRSLDKNR